jgi:predicted secreted acid phosphatase
MGMHDTYYNPTAALTNRIAATELKKGKPKRVSFTTISELMAAFQATRRFSTAVRFGDFLPNDFERGKANGKQILSEKSVSLLTTEKYFGRAFGFDVNSSNHSWIKGKCFGAKTFCHSATPAHPSSATRKAKSS